jgi:hypothetical protein
LVQRTSPLLGTFLFNCDYQRYYFKMFERTVSLWTHVNQPMELRQYLNPIYQASQRLIRMSAHPLNIQPWMALFARWSLSRENADEVNDIVLFVRHGDPIATLTRTKIPGRSQRSSRTRDQSAVVAPHHGQ